MSWHNKKQKSVALSTVEAEYIAAGLGCAQVFGCAQVLWMKQTLSDFDLKLFPLNVITQVSLAYQRISCNTLEPSI